MRHAANLGTVRVASAHLGNRCVEGTAHNRRNPKIACKSSWRREAAPDLQATCAPALAEDCSPEPFRRRAELCPARLTIAGIRRSLASHHGAAKRRRTCKRRAPLGSRRIVAPSHFAAVPGFARDGSQSLESEDRLQVIMAPRSGAGLASDGLVGGLKPCPFREPCARESPARARRPLFAARARLRRGRVCRRLRRG